MKTLKEMMRIHIFRCWERGYGSRSGRRICYAEFVFYHSTNDVILHPWVNLCLAQTHAGWAARLNP